MAVKLFPYLELCRRSTSIAVLIICSVSLLLSSVIYVGYNSRARLYGQWISLTEFIICLRLLVKSEHDYTKLVRHNKEIVESKGLWLIQYD